jgi:hypothetical protein
MALCGRPRGYGQWAYGSLANVTWSNLGFQFKSGMMNPACWILTVNEIDETWRTKKGNQCLGGIVPPPCTVSPPLSWALVSHLARVGTWAGRTYLYAWFELWIDMIERGRWIDVKSVCDLIWFDLIWFNLDGYELICFDLIWIGLNWFALFVLIWFDLIWFEMNWIELDLIWFELDWIDLLRLVGFDPIWFGFIWFDLNWIDLIWIELNWESLLCWIDLIWCNLDWIELNWFAVIWLERVASNWKGGWTEAVDICCCVKVTEIEWCYFDFIDGANAIEYAFE